MILASFSRTSLSFTDKESLDYFAGKWEIRMWTGKETKRDPDINATWFLNKEEKDKHYKGYVQLGDKVFTSETIYFDEKEKAYTRIISVSTGTRIELKTKGWEKNKLVWKGTQNDGSNLSELKEEITRVGDNEFTAIFYELRKGSWALTQTEKIKRIDL